MGAGDGGGSVSKIAGKCRRWWRVGLKNCWWVQEMVEGRSRPAPIGVLAFTCNGRGLELFGRAHHDASSLQQFIPAPLAGFMCNGA